MSAKQWQYGMTLDMDPQAVRDYDWDFASWLEGDSIQNASVEAENCTANKQSNSTTSVLVRVSDVAAGASVTIVLAMASGQMDNFTIYYNPVER